MANRRTHAHRPHTHTHTHTLTNSLLTYLPIIPTVPNLHSSVTRSVMNEQAKEDGEKKKEKKKFTPSSHLIPCSHRTRGEGRKESE